MAGCDARLFAVAKSRWCLPCPWGLVLVDRFFLLPTTKPNPSNPMPEPNQVSVRLMRPWSATQSSFARGLGERAMAQSVLHLDAHRRLWWINICFVLPTIVLSLLGGACNSSQASLVALWPQDEQEKVSHVLPLILGLVGLLVSVLNSIQSYLGTARLVESHWIAHTGFSKLQRLIASEVGLPHQERSVSGTEAITSWRSQYDQLLENSPSLSVKLEKRFSARRDVRRAGIVVPPNIKVRPIKTYEEIEQEQRAAREEAAVSGASGATAASTTTSTSTTSSTTSTLRQALTSSFRRGRRGRTFVPHTHAPTPPPTAPPPPSPTPTTHADINRQRRETQIELDTLQQFTQGRVAAVARGGFGSPINAGEVPHQPQPQRQAQRAEAGAANPNRAPQVVVESAEAGGAGLQGSSSAQEASGGDSTLTSESSGSGSSSSFDEGVSVGL